MLGLHGVLGHLGGACALAGSRGRVGLMLIGVAGLGAALLLLAETRPALPAEEDVTLEGIVAEAPTYQADRGRAVLVVQDGALGKVRLYLTAEEEAVAAVRVGDFVRANARLWLDAPEDFALYLWRYGIVASAFAEEAAFEPGGFSAARALDSVRAGISGKIDALFPHTADLVKALILGDRSELAEEQNDAYARAGVAHLLAVSGLHVSIIAGLFDQALRKLRVPRLVVLCVVFCALLAYSVLVGMGASIVRAVLMYAIAGVGRQLGRPRDGVQCLGVAAVIQLLIQPLWLFDAGFILSYTAIAGIQLVGEPLFQRVKGRLRHKAVRSVVQNLLVSYGACLGTLPCVVAIYGWTSAYGLLLNLVAIPLSVYATYGCVAVLFVGAAWLMAGKLLSILPEFLLFLLNWLTEWTASLPGSVLFLRPWAAWFCGALCARRCTGFRQAESSPPRGYGFAGRATAAAHRPRSGRAPHGARRSTRGISRCGTGGFRRHSRAGQTVFCGCGRALFRRGGVCRPQWRPGGSGVSFSPARRPRGRPGGSAGKRFGWRDIRACRVGGIRCGRG